MGVIQPKMSRWKGRRGSRKAKVLAVSDQFPPFLKTYAKPRLPFMFDYTWLQQITLWERIPYLRIQNTQDYPAVKDQAMRQTRKLQLYLGSCGRSQPLIVNKHKSSGELQDSHRNVKTKAVWFNSQLTDSVKVGGQRTASRLRVSRPSQVKKERKNKDDCDT